MCGAAIGRRALQVEADYLNEKKFIHLYRGVKFSSMKISDKVLEGFLLPIHAPYIHIYIRIYIYIYIHACMYVSMHTYIFLDFYVYRYVYLHIYIFYNKKI
jgi:hypothetical protein